MMSIATDLPRRPVEACHSSTTQAIRRWLDDSAGGQCGLEYAASALEWCRRLPQLADMLPATVWRSLLDHLVHSAVEAAAPHLADDPREPDPLVHQLLAGELALTLASLFPKIRACRRLLPRARRALSAGLADLLDGEGLPHAGHFDRLWPLLACWTRCRTLGSRWKRGCWPAEADARYRQFVRHALRLVRRDGSLAFSEESADREGAAALAAAVAMVGGQHDRTIAAIALPGGKKSRRRLAGVGTPKAAVHSEWAATAVLRSDWSRSAPRLAVLYPGESCRVELACGKDVLWSGDWGFEVRIDGLPVSPVSEWSNTCWVSDEDVDYLELEIELGEGLRIQRHIVMARKDRFLLLADAVLGSRRAALEYRGTLPLGRRITFRATGETSEGLLVGRKARAVAIPLALPEWLDSLPSPSERGTGGEGLENMQRQNGPITHSKALTLALSRRERGRFAEVLLELRQSACGRSLFAPLFFDLDRRRFGTPPTWRQLTVAESLAIQPADAAVGYRVSAGGKQWLIYRSLTPSRNRTLLGHNLSSETLVARFTRKGEVTPLIEIE